MESAAILTKYELNRTCRYMIRKLKTYVTYLWPVCRFDIVKHINISSECPIKTVIQAGHLENSWSTENFSQTFSNTWNDATALNFRTIVQN